jgi:hypothetical protein
LGPFDPFSLVGHFVRLLEELVTELLKVRSEERPFSHRSDNLLEWLHAGVIPVPGAGFSCFSYFQTNESALSSKVSMQFGLVEVCNLLVGGI